MFSSQVYDALLALVSVYTLLRGRSDERIAAAVCVAATIAAGLVDAARASVLNVEGIALIDAGALAIFTTLALRSERFWPLWLAGLQLAAVYAHVLTALNFGLLPQELAPPANFWGYPIVLIIAAGTWRGSRRRSASVGLERNQD
jgi:hypothetical protein